MRCARRPAIPLWLVLLAAGSPGRAGALPLPATAYSTSVRAPSPLLDDPVNFLLFPQLARSEGSGLSSFGAAGTSSRGGGVRFARGDHALHYAYRGISSPVRYRVEGPAFQVGWSWQPGSARLGVAFAWATEGLKDTETRFRSSRREAFTFDTVDHRSLSLGAGWERPGAAVDVVVGAIRNDVRYSWDLRSVEPLSEIALQTESFSLHLNGDLQWRAAIRARLRIDDRSSLRFHASFEDQSQVLEIERRQVRRAGVISVREYRAREEPHGHTWLVGGRLEHLAGDVLVGAHASLEDERPAGRYEIFSNVWQRRRVRSRTLRAGISVELPFVWELEARSGVDAFVQRREDAVLQIEDRQFDASSSRLRRSRDELSGFGFAWGLAREFGSFQLVATLSGSLDLDEIFGLVDAHLRF